MRRKNRMIVGRAAVSVLSYPKLLALALIVLGAGLAMCSHLPETLEFVEEGWLPYIRAAGAALIIASPFVARRAWRRDDDHMYMRRGRCRITGECGMCHGACAECDLAQEYIRVLNGHWERNR
ncbi:MAG: hypothetical protein Q4Q62_06970 [Thermoplasmata archaeon]|nr:hypothetical protein [Thermoplasmata archaeon]